MSARTAVETLQAAIEKMEELKAAGYFVVNGWLCEEPPGDTARDFSDGTDGASPLTNDPMFVILFRTIDAQLAILRAARDDFQQYGGKPSKFFANDVALAAAILGEES
jgi:hypothetical protein